VIAFFSLPWSISHVRAAEKPAELTKFLERRAQMAADFAAPISVCVQRQDSSHPVFHGCMDWHSAAHGLWALSAYAWATHDNRYEPLVRSILTPAGLVLEDKFLTEHPDFEMPYGRAWFLRLAIDRRRIENVDALDAMADNVAASLVGYYTKTPPDPSSIAYRSATWALLNLYAYGKSRDDAKIVGFVDQLVRQNYLQKGACPVASREVSSHEFMALCTNWAWLVGNIERRDQFRSWLSDFLPANSLPDPIEDPSSVHQNGLNFSRSWGLWNLYCQTGDARYLHSYLSHLNQTYSEPASWNGEYETVGHWVPQFGMMALMVSYYSGPC
jgi:hypothetical protein